MGIHENHDNYKRILISVLPIGDSTKHKMIIKLLNNQNKHISKLSIKNFAKHETIIKTRQSKSKILIYPYYLLGI